MAQEAFPLHALVWSNQYLELDRELQKDEVHLHDILTCSYLLVLDENNLGQSGAVVFCCMKR